MTKDRLDDLKKQAQKKKNGDVVIEAENGTTGSNTKNLKNTFQKAEVLNQWIESIEKNVEIIKEYLKNTDDIRLNRKDVTEKLQDLFQTNTNIAHRITSKLKEFDFELNKINKESAEGRIKSIQFNTLKTRFIKAFEEDSQCLKSLKEIQKSIIQGQIKAKGVNVSDEELERLLEDGGNVQLFTENILAETAEAKRMLADIEERHQQIMKIERMLTEVRDLFLQMSILVDNQQELLDRVEYQAQLATEAIAAVDLHTARKRKKRYTKRKIYIVIALLILLAIILILIFK